MTKRLPVEEIRRIYAATGNKTETARRTRTHRQTVSRLVEGVTVLVTDTDTVTPAEPVDMASYKFDDGAYRKLGWPTPVRDIIRFKRPGAQTYLLTSAQNNTAVHEPFWQNLLAYAEHLDARVMVGGFIYRKEAQGQRGQEKESEDEGKISMQWDPRLDGYRADKRETLIDGLDWMGHMNALPTNVDPLSGLTNYSRGASAIYPHVKIAMRSVATAPATDPKFLYTTGAVTVPNYIQRKAGQVAEFHHIIGALIVEVEDGQWFARQINATDDGAFQDLDATVKDGRVSRGHSVYAINWGDVHERKLSDDVFAAAWGEDGLLDELRPQYQFFHDLVDAESANPHTLGDHLQRYALDKENRNDIRRELEDVGAFLRDASRPGVVSVVVPANHDDMVLRWLKSADHKREPKNMRFYHEASLAALDSIDKGEGVDLLKWYLDGKVRDVVFIPPSKPTMILKGIEFGQHGHLGPNGNRKPTPKAYSVLAMKVNKGHTHTADITDGVYTAGVMELEHGYNVGYSSWSRSHIITYPNGKRAIITQRNNLKYKGNR